MIYFSKITHVLSCTNKLEKDIAAHMKTIDHKSIPAEHKQIFLNTLKQKVKEISEANPRCKPIVLNVWDTDRDTLSMTVGKVSFNLYKEKV